jgi:CBS domain-containing protein
MKVRDVMTSPAITVAPEASFKEMADRMVSNDVSGLPVVDAEGHLLGIVSEADLVSKEAYGGRRRRLLEVLADLVAGGESRWAAKARGLRAEHVMTRVVDTVEPDADLAVTAREMVEKRLKRMPVVEGGKVVGMLARRDVLALYGRTDAELSADVDGLLRDPMRTPEDATLTATVRDGVVTFVGSTRYPSDRTVVQAMAWRIAGVVGVDTSAVTAREGEPRVVPS